MCHFLLGGVIMEKDLEYRQRIIAEYKEAVMPLLRYLPWLEQHAGKSVSATYQGDNIGEGTLKFPVYDGTLMNFVREASKSSLMEKNYQYVFTRNRLKTHEDERKAIIKAQQDHSGKNDGQNGHENFTHLTCLPSDNRKYGVRYSGQ